MKDAMKFFLFFLGPELVGATVLLLGLPAQAVLAGVLFGSTVRALVLYLVLEHL